MSEFKVGDRVKMIAYKRYAKIIEAKVICSKQHYLISFEDDASECLFPEIDLEIVDEDGKTLLEQRIERLEEIVNKQNNCQQEQNNSQICKISAKNEEIISKSQLLTEDERVILRNLDKKWKWIGRDEVNCLRIFKDKPYREKGYWRSLGNYEFLDVFNHLFCFIGLKDDEPYNIEELLKGECDKNAN